MRKRQAYMVVAAFTALTAVWWVALQLASDHATLWNYGFNLVYGAAYAIAGLLAARAAFRWRKADSSDVWSMAFVSGGLLSSAVAQAIWFGYNLIADVEIPTVSFADVFFVLGALSFLAGFGSFFFHKYRADEHWRKSAKGWAVVLVLILLSVPVFLFRLFGYEETFSIAFDAFYSSSSILLALFVLFNLMQDRHRRLFPFFTVSLVASLATAVGDLVFGVRDGFGLYWNGDVSDGLYAFGAVLFLFACIACVPSDPDGEDQDLGGIWQVRRRDLVLVSLVLVVGTIIAGKYAEEHYLAQTKTLTEDASTAAQQFDETLSSRLAAHQRETLLLSKIIETAPEANRVSDFRSAAEIIVKTQKDESFFSLLSPQGKVVSAVDASDDIERVIIGYDYTKDPVRAPLLLKALQTRKPVVSDVLTLLSGDQGILIVTPVYAGEALFGTIIASLPLSELFWDSSPLVRDGTVEGLVVTTGAAVSGAGVPIKETERVTGLTDDPVTQSDAFAVGDEEWVAYARPSRNALIEAQTEAYLSFLGALIFVALITVIVYLFLSQAFRLKRDLSLRTHELDERLRELARFKFFLDNVSDAVLVVDPGYGIVYANPAVLHQTGYALKDLTGKDYRNLFRFIEKPGHRVVFSALESGKPFAGEAEIETGDRKVAIFLSVAPYREADGTAGGTIVAWQDITPIAEAQRAKSQFVSFVAHQLRAPMTQMRWNLESLLTRKLPTEAREAIEALQQSVLTENKFVADLLNVSRIERGVLKIDVESVAVGTLIERAVEPLRLMAKEKGIVLEIPKNHAAASVRVDAGKAVEALRNVVDNAIKYSPRKTPVQISVEPLSKSVVIRVRDHGPGIPEEKREDLFDMKVGDTQVSVGSGAGIGLFLARKFLEAMGGSISFETSELGTAFFLHLPKAGKSR